MSTALIYEKFNSAVSLSDMDIIEGRQHFKQLADLLFASGREFLLAAREANRVYLALDGYFKARGLKDEAAQTDDGFVEGAVVRDVDSGDEGIITSKHESKAGTWWVEWTTGEDRTKVLWQCESLLELIDR